MDLHKVALHKDKCSDLFEGFHHCLNFYRHFHLLKPATGINIYYTTYY